MSLFLLSFYDVGACVVQTGRSLLSIDRPSCQALPPDELVVVDGYQGPAETRPVARNGTDSVQIPPFLTSRLITSHR